MPGRVEEIVGVFGQAVLDRLRKGASLAGFDRLLIRQLELFSVAFELTNGFSV